jgi:hypothetical protein
MEEKDRQVTQRNGRLMLLSTGFDFQDEALNWQELNHTAPAAAATVQESLNTPFPKTPSKNPFHHSHTSKNPFAQSSKDSISHNSQFHPHHYRSASDPLQSSTFQSSPQAMPIPNSQHSKHGGAFPMIQSSSGQFNITHIGGDQNIMDSSSHIMSSNSGNTTTTTTTNSNNDSSIINIGIDEFPQSVLLQQHLLALRLAKESHHLPKII